MRFCAFVCVDQYKFCLFLTCCQGSTSRKEIVLGMVAERKRADDLASSIVDGRFVEQKVAASHFLFHPSHRNVTRYCIISSLFQSRMQKLGFRKMYIFEECKNMYNLRISHETLLQAMINSEVVHFEPSFHDL